jgi:single-strand DNA-binding protein
MNRVIQLGRVVKDAEVRYSGDMAVARFTLAVNRRFKRQGEPDADFFNCVAFGKTGEFAEKYMKKGGQFAICGRLQNRSWEQDGQKRYATDIVAEEIYFAGGKEDGAKGVDPIKNAQDKLPWAEVESLADDEMPF